MNLSCFRPLLFVHFHVLVGCLTNNALTGIMAGKICADVVLFSYDYLRSNETQKLFLNHTTNKSDKHKILFLFLMKSPSRKNLDHKFVININTYFISNHFSLSVTNKASTIGKEILFFHTTGDSFR
jgi:uncharacterized protein YijF (DUF1287 family)